MFTFFKWFRNLLKIFILLLCMYLFRGIILTSDECSLYDFNARRYYDLFVAAKTKNSIPIVYNQWSDSSFYTNAGLCNRKRLEELVEQIPEVKPFVDRDSLRIVVIRGHYPPLDCILKP